MHIVETAREKIAFTGAVQPKQPRVTFARIPFPRCDQQIHFASQPRQRRHHRAPRAVFHHQLRNKQRVRKIGERVLESLLRVHASQRVEIGFSVGSNVHVLPRIEPERLEHAVAQERMHPRDSFGRVERGRARRDSVRRECRLRCL